jgi:hypothetical protein
MATSCGAVSLNIDVVVAKRRTSSRRASVTTSRATLSDYDDDVERLPEALDLCRLTNGSYAAVRWVRNDGETMTMDVVVLAAEASSSPNELFETDEEITVRREDVRLVDYKAYDLEQRKISDRLEDPHGEHARDCWVVYVG